MIISVIIPVYHERRNLVDLVSQLKIMIRYGHEIIVVDGDISDDATRCMLDSRVIVVHSDKGRAKQMNAGARQASGNIYWFLHADSDFSQPLEHYLQLISTLNNHQWGRFQLKIDAPAFIYRIIETMINFRSKITGISTGDQSLFIHKDLFDRVGGFTDIEIMEDIDMSRKLKKISRPVIAQTCLITSARRWQSRGILRTILLMWKLRLYYFFGVAPKKLAKMYD